MIREEAPKGKSSMLVGDAFSMKRQMSHENYLLQNRLVALVGNPFTPAAAPQGTGLLNASPKRQTSIIEKLTNLTYSTMEMEDDATIVECLAAQTLQEQDISPGVKTRVNPPPPFKSLSGKKRRAKRKKVNASTTAVDESEPASSPTLEFQSSSQSDASPILVERAKPGRRSDTEVSVTHLVE